MSSNDWSQFIQNIAAELLVTLFLTLCGFALAYVKSEKFKKIIVGIFSRLMFIQKWLFAQWRIFLIIVFFAIFPIITFIAYRNWPFVFLELGGCLLGITGYWWLGRISPSPIKSTAVQNPPQSADNVSNWNAKRTFRQEDVRYIKVQLSNGNYRFEIKLMKTEERGLCISIDNKDVQVVNFIDKSYDPLQYRHAPNFPKVWLAETNEVYQSDGFSSFKIMDGNNQRDVNIRWTRSYNLLFSPSGYTIHFITVDGYLLYSD